MSTKHYRLRPFHTYSGIPFERLTFQRMQRQAYDGVCLNVQDWLAYIAAHNYLLSKEALKLRRGMLRAQVS